MKGLFPLVLGCWAGLAGAYRQDDTTDITKVAPMTDPDAPYDAFDDDHTGIPFPIIKMPDARNSTATNSTKFASSCKASGDFWPYQVFLEQWDTFNNIWFNLTGTDGTNYLKTTIQTMEESGERSTAEYAGPSEDKKARHVGWMNDWDDQTGRIMNLCLPYDCFNIDTDLGNDDDDGDEGLAWRIYDLTDGTEVWSGGMGVKSRGAFCAPSCTHHGKRRVQMLLSSYYEGWYTAQVEISSHKDGLIVSETKGNYPDDYIYEYLPDNGGSGMFGDDFDDDDDDYNDAADRRVDLCLDSGCYNISVDANHLSGDDYVLASAYQMFDRSDSDDPEEMAVVQNNGVMPGSASFFCTSDIGTTFDQGFFWDPMVAPEAPYVTAAGANDPGAYLDDDVLTAETLQWKHNKDIDDDSTAKALNLPFKALPGITNITNFETWCEAQEGDNHPYQLIWDMYYAGCDDWDLGAPCARFSNITLNLTDSESGNVAFSGNPYTFYDNVSIADGDDAQDIKSRHRGWVGDDPAKNIRVKNLCLPYGCYDLEVTGDQLIETGWRMFDLTTGTETLSGGLGVSMKAATCVPTCESQSKIRTQLQYGATFDSDEDWESFILKITSQRTGDVVVQETLGRYNNIQDLIQDAGRTKGMWYDSFDDDGDDRMAFESWASWARRSDLCLNPGCYSVNVTAVVGLAFGKSKKEWQLVDRTNAKGGKWYNSLLLASASGTQRELGYEKFCTGDATFTPTISPVPTSPPSPAPTQSPAPTSTPTQSPTQSPAPTSTPTQSPTSTPTQSPTSTPSQAPSQAPVQVIVTQSMSGFSCAEFGTAEESAFVGAIAASSDSVETQHVSDIACTDATSRRRLHATTDSTLLDYTISLPQTDDDGDVAAQVQSQLTSAINDGSFTSALASASDDGSVLASATSTGVVTHLHTTPPSAAPTATPKDDDDDDDDGLTGAGIALIILAAIALTIGGYLIFLKEGFCFNTGPKEEAGGQEMVAAKANDVNVTI